jgi:hypothetical protein
MALGIVEGVAEATASLLKVVSGIWADKIKSGNRLSYPGTGWPVRYVR